MKFKIFLILSAFLSVFCNKILADSPITSTYFYEYYSDSEIVKDASENNGVLTKKMCKYLKNKNVKIAYKLALINALSWDINGKNNFEIYLNFLTKRNIWINKKNYKKRLNANQLICLAYLKAMDNYFKVDQAYFLAQRAVEKKSKSLSINVIYAAIRGQYMFGQDWCEIYLSIKKVKENKDLNSDMKDAAFEQFYDYMSLYKSYCPNNKK